MLVSLGWVLATVLEIFMFLFDTTVYGLAIVCINVFNGIARMDLFSTKAGAALYTDIARRFYAVIGIVMIFFFAYQLILLIINPDGDTKASTNLVKTTITSLMMVAFFPTLYRYMGEFQEHVLTEGTITSIVLGQGASGGDSDASGRNTALIVYLSMFHPGDGGYNSVVNSDQWDDAGNAAPRTSKECQDDSGANEETCDLWIEAYGKYAGGGSFGGITAFTLNNKLIQTINEDGGSTYYAVIIVICGAVLVWFYASYAIDLGYRTVKLGFLQIISPAPLIMRIFPKTAKTFEKWKHELITTYLSVFVRVFIVSFVIAIIQKIPIIIIGLFEALSMSGWCIPFAIVALVFGILKFGKELPKLCKDIFENGAGLLNGIDWKPGVGRRLKSGADDVVGFGKKMANYGRKLADKTVGAAVRAPLRAKRGIARVGGMVSGFKKGGAGAVASNKTKGLGTVRALAKGGFAGARAGFQAGGLYDPTDKNAKISDAIKNAGNAGGIAGNTTELFNLKKYGESFVKDFGLQTMDAKTARIDELKGNISAANKEAYDKLGVTDKKTKADEFARTEIDKAREALKNGETLIRGRAMNEKGEYGGEVKTFKSMADMEKYYATQKALVQKTQMENLFENNSTNSLAREVMSTTTQTAQENLEKVLQTAMDPKIVQDVMKKASGKFNADAIKKMYELGAFGEGSAAIARRDDLLAQAQTIVDAKKEVSDLKLDREQLNREITDLKNGRDKLSETLYAQIGQVDDAGKTINPAYIEAKLKSFDSDIQTKIDAVNKVSDKITAKEDALTTVNLTDKEVSDFLGKASIAFSEGKTGDAKDSAYLGHLVHEVNDELVKGIAQASQHIAAVNAVAEAANDSGKSGGDSDKK